MDFRIILLIIFWPCYWFFYESVLLKRDWGIENNPFINSIIYFFLAYLLILYTGVPLGNYIYIFVSIALVIVVLAFLTKHRQFGRLSNSLFQMSWMFAFYNIVGDRLWILGLVFFFLHTPVLLVERINLRAKLALLAFSFLGGMVFAFLLVNVPFGWNWISIVLVHYFFYMLLRPLEKRYNWNIIN